MLTKRLRAVFGICIAALLVLGGCSSPKNAPISSEQTVSTADSEVQSSTEKIRLPEMDRKIDWKTLHKQNADICAWISVPSVNVDYPVLQADETKDDYYYLERDLDGKEDIYGSIFSERYNHADFSDPVTILYGHSSFVKDTPKGKEMFTDLHKYKDQSFLDEHPDVFIYTPEGAIHYELFCVSVFDDRYILGNYGFIDPKEVELFIHDLESTQQHWINPDISFNAADRFLVLSTCMAVNSDQRLVMIAVQKESDIVKVKNEASKTPANRKEADNALSAGDSSQK